MLWLWQGPAATAPIRPLAWEPPYSTDAALKKQKEKKKKERKKERKKIRAIISKGEVSWEGYWGISKVLVIVYFLDLLMGTPRFVSLLLHKLHFKFPSLYMIQFAIF